MVTIGLENLPENHAPATVDASVSTNAALAPLVIGVTSHRNIPAREIESIRQRARDLFPQLQFAHIAMFVARHCHLPLATWEGKPSRPKESPGHAARQM